MAQTRCMRCMKEYKKEYGVCPHCGYVPEAAAVNPLYLPEGTVLDGKYLVGTAVGHGGFGITYVAFDLSLEHKVAIKEYFPYGLSTRTTERPTVLPMTTQDAETNYRYGREKFIEEARTLAKFSRLDSIVSVLTCFSQNNTAYIVMEYLDGEDLLQYVKRRGGKLEWDETLRLIVPVFDALMAIHDAGMIHRDISPDNIFITNNSEIKLLDFGTARFAMGEKSKSLSVILKPGYAPPEQYFSRGKQGPWTDIYALAATVYRVVTGQSPADAVERQMNVSLDLSDGLGENVPDTAKKALLKALALEPGERPQTVAEFRQELYGARSGQQSAPRPKDSGTPDAHDASSQPKPDEVYAWARPSRAEQQGDDWLNGYHDSQKEPDGSKENDESGTDDFYHRPGKESLGIAHPETKKLRKRILFAVIAAALATGLYFLITEIDKSQRYQTAFDYYYSGQYETAAQYFWELDGYSDAYYWYDNAHAYALLDNGDYDAAREIFSYLSNTDMVNECDYRKAEQWLSEGDYNGAKTLFLGIGETERANECDYLQADLYLSEGDYDSAKALFLNIGEIDRANECDYQKANDLLYMGEQEAAFEILLSLESNGGYADSYQIVLSIQEEMINSVFGGLDNIIVPEAYSDFPALFYQLDEMRALAETYDIDDVVSDAIDTKFNELLPAYETAYFENVLVGQKEFNSNYFSKISLTTSVNWSVLRNRITSRFDYPVERLEVYCSLKDAGAGLTLIYEIYKIEMDTDTKLLEVETSADTRYVTYDYATEWVTTGNEDPGYQPGIYHLKAIREDNGEVLASLYFSVGRN
ncbi:MAG: protein kinase [Eubacteriales bacterium]|nr:protein kinase [Eubacteriales bacterium]